MTIVSVCSDLHLEMGDCTLPGGDLLLVAGDLLKGGELQPERVDKEARRNRECYKRFAAAEFRKYWKVLVILGNHDFWGLYFDEAPKVIREFLFKHAPNTALLDNEFIELDGVRFIGSTLWATYGYGTANHYFLQKGMKDFARIKKHGSRFLVGDVYEAHQKAIAFLKEALRTDKPCIVMTHHAPSYLAIKRKYYPNGQWDDAYASNQAPLILANPQIKGWFSGHSHYRYRANIGETKVAANPRGYYGHERESMSFDASELDWCLETFEFIP